MMHHRVIARCPGIDYHAGWIEAPTPQAAMDRLRADSRKGGYALPANIVRLMVAESCTDEQLAARRGAAGGAR
ncbi:MAG: hypothetical protein AB7K09_24400 [Planctomycetota bacterium]